MNTPWQEVSERGCGWWVSNEPVKLAAALSEMMTFTNDERRHMGECARNLVEEKYTWDAVVKAIVNSHKEVMGLKT